MEIFKAKLGTTFYYNLDLSGNIMVVRDLGLTAQESPMRIGHEGDDRVGLTVPAEDFMEFAAHVAGLPPWEPEKDPYDHETTRLMVAHTDNCSACGATNRCSEYWKLILERTREKERKHTH